MKKRQVSNRTILSLLVVALVITVLSTGITIFKSSGNNFSLTGAVTDTGVTSVTVTATTALINQVPQVNFGSGYVNETATSCGLVSNGTSEEVSNCVSFTNITQGFVLENTGNTNVSLNWSCSGNCTASDLIGGTNPSFLIRFQTASTAYDQSNQDSANDTVASCGGFLLNTTFGEIGGEGTESGEWICGDDSGQNYSLDIASSADAILMDFNLTIPEDATTGAGQQNATFTFTATASG